MLAIAAGYDELAQLAAAAAKATTSRRAPSGLAGGPPAPDALAEGM
jgi:hypothetical protein